MYPSLTCCMITVFRENKFASEVCSLVSFPKVVVFNSIPQCVPSNFGQVQMTCHEQRKRSVIYVRETP